MGRSHAGRNRGCRRDEGAGVNCFKPFELFLFSSPADAGEDEGGVERLERFERFEPLVFESKTS
jgi:hypothetical protein